MKLSLIAIITAWYAAIALWLKVMIPLHIPSNDSSAKWRIEQKMKTIHKKQRVDNVLNSQSVKSRLDFHQESVIDALFTAHLSTENLATPHLIAFFTNQF